jgi:hypothetical protein
MPCGPKPKPEYARYYAAGHGPTVYVVEVGDAVKVGRSDMPTVRLKDLHCVHRRDGIALGRFHVFPAPDRDLYRAERRAIHALQRVATALPGRIEYFAGITFDDAVKVVREAVPSPA